ncbi:kinase [Thraustotheca clavata]|uniref:Kinase n=1 Tax=Thraustotheca clavata TaxID=74557 RepID=A0A1V9ZZP2_9STRA|nr:kinase [Thraustotheca clavata]
MEMNVAKQFCLNCASNAPICTAGGAITTINIVTTNSAANTDASLDLNYKVLADGLTFTDNTSSINTLNIVRAFDGKAYRADFGPNMFTAMKGLAYLNVNCKDSGINDVYLEITNVDETALPSSLSSLTMNGCFTKSIRLAANSNLVEINVNRHEMSELPRVGISNLLSAQFTTSEKLTVFPYQFLDLKGLTLLNLTSNNISVIDFPTQAEMDKYTSLGAQAVMNGAFQDSNVTCTGFAKIPGVCKGVSAASSSNSNGPSTGAVTTLVVVSCIASILVLVAIIVHRRTRRGPGSRSPGALSSAHSPDDFFYDVDEAYVTNQTMSKYKTAGANDATLTKLPPEHIALARCLGGDIWMGEMTTTNARIALRRAPRMAGDHVTDSFFQGVKEMARLSHPNLVTYMGVTCLSGTDIYAVSEFMDKGSLANVYQTIPLTWDTQLRMALDVAEAIHYLHTFLPSPVPCEHLKSSMVLVSSNYTCKLNIFHFMASFKAHVLCKEMYGANRIAWKAPEVLINEWNNFLAADVYSLGVVLAEIGTASRPFDREISEVGMVQTDVWILDNVMAGRGVPPPFDTKSNKWTSLPDQYQKLILACLDPVPSRRPNSGIVLQRLKDLKPSIHSAEL